jgi:Mg-chelatase subunit ChlD
MFSARDLAARFIGGEEGGVMIPFTLSILAVGMAIGVAFDSARGYNVKEVLQQDLDATLLFVAKQKAASGDENFDVQAAAQNYIRSLNREKQVDADIAVQVTQPDPSKFKGEATAGVPTTLGRLLGVSVLGVTVESEVALGEQPIEVALVLDNTGSMAGAKLQGLKDAAKSLIDIAYQALKADENVKIGIIPFGQYVNVGMSHRNAPWMSVVADWSNSRPEECYQTSPVIGTSNCRDEQQTWYVDGVPTTSTVQVCDYQYGPEVTQCYTPVDSGIWYGCAGSRDYPLETLDDDYATPIPGVMNVTCPGEITPLTNDVGALNTEIDAMVATGDTYIPSGLIWGQRVLSKKVPYEEAKGKNEKVNGQTTRKVMVLMTDGFNTLSPTYPAHDGGVTALSNTLTTEICTNIKNEGIELYTVAFEVPDEAMKTILEGCASSPSKYHDAGNSEQLETAFEQIAKDFNKLRLTR